jgi:PDZ domain-containing protein
MKSNESGPSGGLMLALSIYNKLVSEDITRGLKIAGTGTIDVDGNVGEIGGVKYKLIGAVKNKAKVFLCPMGNLEEAKAVAENYKYDIIVIGVASFDQALNELRNL